jgi:hypothetical protein
VGDKMAGAGGCLVKGALGDSDGQQVSSRGKRGLPGCRLWPASRERPQETNQENREKISLHP